MIRKTTCRRRCNCPSILRYESIRPYHPIPRRHKRKNTSQLVDWDARRRRKEETDFFFHSVWALAFSAELCCGYYSHLAPVAPVVSILRTKPKFAGIIRTHQVFSVPGCLRHTVLNLKSSFADGKRVAGPLSRHLSFSGHWSLSLNIGLDHLRIPQEIPTIPARMAMYKMDKHVRMDILTLRIWDTGSMNLLVSNMYPA